MSARSLAAPALAGLLFAAPCQAAGKWHLEASGEALGYSEPVPLVAFINGWHVPLEKGSDASAVLRYSLTAGYGAWRVGRVYQDAYHVEASRAAAVIYHRVSNDLGFAPGETFDAELSVRAARSLGWRLGRVFDAGNFGVVEGGLTRWHGTALIHGRLSAVALALTEDDYRYDGSIDYYYNKDALFGRPERGANGYGWGLDLRWQGRQGPWEWMLKGNNLLASIRWKNALHTSGQFSSAGQETGGFAPTLTGREDRKTLHQHLPADARVELAWHAPRGHRLALGSTWLPSGQSLELKAGHGWKGWSGQAKLLAIPVLGAGVELQGYGLRLAYTADALDFSKARWAEARLSYAWNFAE